MNKMSSKALSLLFGVLLSAGCSVKEYRESCPCRLVLDFSETDTLAVRSADLYVTVPEGVFRICSQDMALREYGKWG